MHAALASVALRAVRSSGLVDDTLLHDGAVHSEAVGRGLVGLCRCGGGDEGLEDSVLGIGGLFGKDGIRVDWTGASGF